MLKGYQDCEYIQTRIAIIVRISKHSVIIKKFLSKKFRNVQCFCRCLKTKGGKK